MSPEEITKRLHVRGFISRREAADIVGRSVRTLIRWSNEGLVKGTEVYLTADYKVVGYSTAEVQKLQQVARAQRTGPPTEDDTLALRISRQPIEVKKRRKVIR